MQARATPQRERLVGRAASEAPRVSSRSIDWAPLQVAGTSCQLRPGRSVGRSSKLLLASHLPPPPRTEHLPSDALFFPAASRREACLPSYLSGWLVVQSTDAVPGISCHWTMARRPKDRSRSSLCSVWQAPSRPTTRVFQQTDLRFGLGPAAVAAHRTNPPPRRAQATSNGPSVQPRAVPEPSPGGFAGGSRSVLDVQAFLASGTSKPVPRKRRRGGSAPCAIRPQSPDAGAGSPGDLLEAPTRLTAPTHTPRLKLKVKSER